MFQVQALLGDADDMHKIRILFIMSLLQVSVLGGIPSILETLER